MRQLTGSFALGIFSVVLTACAHHSTSTGRTISVNANETVTAEPDLAILHIGFDTPPEDLKSAYADGSRRSNAIIATVKHAGIPQDAIRSEWQNIDRVWTDEHKFKVSQQWSVKVPPERAAEILDTAIAAGANSSGQIDWTVKDQKALDDEALGRASARATENAAALAKGMGVRLGTLLSVSNQISASPFAMSAFGMAGAQQQLAAPKPLVIEPHLVSRNATVSAVFAID